MTLAVAEASNPNKPNHLYGLNFSAQPRAQILFLVFHREQSIGWAQLTFSRTFNTGLSQLSSALITVENQNFSEWGAKPHHFFRGNHWLNQGKINSEVSKGRKVFFCVILLVNSPNLSFLRQLAHPCTYFFIPPPVAHLNWYSTSDIQWMPTCNLENLKVLNFIATQYLTRGIWQVLSQIICQFSYCLSVNLNLKEGTSFCHFSHI